MAITGAIRTVFADNPEQFDPRKYLGPGRDAMKKVCIERMTAFGQAGWAPKVPTKTLGDMAVFYGL